MGVDQELLKLDQAILLLLVRQVMRRDDVELLGWELHTLSSLLGAAALSTVHRLSGTARVGGERCPWSLILKILARPSGAAAVAGWDREIAAFRSGLLEDLPRGLVAPRCFGIDERSEAIWIWMEDVAQADGGGRWPVARFGLAARHLGRFSGRSLAEQPLPDAPWLSRALLRGRIDQNADFWDGRLQVNDDALLEQIFPGGLIERARQVWDERHQLLDLLDRLPQTLVHGDADRRNLFTRRDTDGEEETAAIDWAWMWVAAVGWDLANLVVASALWYEAEIGDLPVLAETCLAGYFAGLADAGWMGDARLVRVGFAVSAALRYGPTGLIGFRLRYPEMGAAASRASGHNPDESAARMGTGQRFVLDLLDAVRDEIGAL
jgi:hypothetical protein